MCLIFKRAVAGIAISVFFIGLIMPDRLTNSQQQPFVTSKIAWSPDGSKIALSSVFGVTLFTSDLQRVTPNINENNTLSALAWSPDSKMLAGARYHNIKVWDANTGLLLFILDNQSVSINSVSWSPNGRYLAAGSSDGRITLWDINYKSVQRIMTQDGGVRVLSWSPIGDRLAVAGPGGVSIWQPNDGTLISTDNTFTDSPSLSWSPDGRNFILKDPEIYSSESAQVGRTLICTLNLNVVFSDWSKNGSRIIFSSNDDAGSSLCVMDGLTFSEINNFPRKSPIFNLSLSPNGKQVVYEESIGVLQEIDTDAGSILYHGPRALPTLTYVPSKLKLIPICSPDPSKYRLWKVRNLNPLDAVFSWSVYNSVTSQSGTKLVQGTEDGVTGETLFTTITEPGINRVQIYSPKNSLQDDQNSISSQCSALTITPTLTMTNSPTSTFIPTATPTTTSTSTVTVTSTSIPPTLTLIPPTITSTSIPPTLTPIPPTITSTPTPIPPISTIGIYRPSVNTFYLKYSNSTGYADVSIPFGNGNSQYPVVGDWTGSGIDTIGLFDRSSGQFQLRNSNTPGTPDYAFILGLPGDIPLAGHWSSALTHDSVGVYRDSNGLVQIFLKNDFATGYADTTIVVGVPGDLPVVGDWDGDGIDTFALYRPSTTLFYFFNQNIPSAPESYEYSLTTNPAPAIPIAGDWSGAGHAGYGIFSEGAFYLKSQLSSGAPDSIINLGGPGDLPITGHWQ